ncbi:hypothetical protein [Campylobacter helveticus]|uniref:hypothetical protein n=1 Tax=Campylobacter helveticus TaxID=28898 RepID=UPI0022EA762C|nr:hypothetical protein [Campylobacter helveticus]
MRLRFESILWFKLEDKLGLWLMIKITIAITKEKVIFFVFSILLSRLMGFKFIVFLGFKEFRYHFIRVQRQRAATPMALIYRPVGR